jgi:hypothetical protein|tara:strand:- start:9495 stop:9653 length:159 start_codon:yes stop_codon:yes gene_type:complete
MITDDDEAWIIEAQSRLEGIAHEFGMDGIDMVLNHLSPGTRDMIVRSLVVSY